MTIFGITAFEGLEPWQIAALAAAYIVAFAVKGVFGYGAVPPMILIGALLMPPHKAVLLAGLVNFAAQGVLLPDGLRSGDRRLARKMVLFILPALVPGVFVFKAMPTDGLQVTLGIMLITILLLESSRWKSSLERVVDRRKEVFGMGSAIFAGLMAGIVGAGGMLLLSVYLRRVLSGRMEFRGTVILIVSAVLVFRTALLAGAGLVTKSLVLEAVLALPVAALSLSVSRRVVGSLSNSAYFLAYWYFMMGASALLVLRGLF